jgi:mono/diheme cytochrome c family protein
VEWGGKVADSDRQARSSSEATPQARGPVRSYLPFGTAWSPLIVGLLVGVIGSVGVVLIVVAPLVLAHRQDLPFEQRYGSVAVSLAARLNAGNSPNPVAGDQRVLRTGLDAYIGSCAACHGSSGNGKGAFGQATYPPATDLTSENTKEKSDAQLFWIIKNGLSFTGMPGFADQYDDTAIWSMVTYLRALEQGQAPTVAVPTPSALEMGVADPAGTSAQRGAAVYFAQGCQSCHGAVGNAPTMGLRGGGEATQAIRSGRPGMPTYSPDQISDSQLNDLLAYMNTFPKRPGGENGGDGGG